MNNNLNFVEWLRAVAPYIHAFRGKTFVVAFPGELVRAGALPVLAHDLSLIHALGIKVVIVHGSRPQIEEQLKLRKIVSTYYKGKRLTDQIALECVKEASGELRLDIEAAFSQGLPNTPMANSAIRLISGNFVTARPIGILNGIDYEHTGIAHKIAFASIHSILNNGELILLSPLGYSATGEVFNLTMEDVALKTAISLKADKLIFLTENKILTNESNIEIREIFSNKASEISNLPIPPESRLYFDSAINASKEGVKRSHIIPFNVDGSLLLEIFTHSGIGTMITSENLESLRDATTDDVPSILRLIEPLEIDGTLVKRGRELIEREAENFSVIEHDGVIFGCAALYPFPKEKMFELACLTVNPKSQGQGEGERLLKHLENKGRKLGYKKIFVLTTRATHWFLKRGFINAVFDELPQNRQNMYNWQRKSQVLIKKL